MDSNHRTRRSGFTVHRNCHYATFPKIEPPVGFEPTTCSLQVSCTTTVLRRQLKVKVNYLYRRTPRSWFLLKAPGFSYLNFCDPGGTRTHGSYIKSVILYQLSYGVILRKANNNPCLSFWVGFLSIKNLTRAISFPLKIFLSCNIVDSFLENRKNFFKLSSGYQHYPQMFIDCLHRQVLFLFVASTGFEPINAAPKTVVLPLH